jgi:hypothetical protein
MTDLDAELRATMHSPPDFVAGSLDVEHIMKAGTRLRRRRIAVRVATTAAVVAVIAGGLQTSSVLDRSDRGSSPAVRVTAPPTPSPIIQTGLKAGPDRQWVIKTVSAGGANAGQKTFGFAINERAADGKLTQDMVISEVTAGEAMKPGFHAVEPVYGYDGGVVQPAYGYFVGDPATITATVDGRSVAASTAASSVDPSVIVFWFDNTTVTADSNLTAVSAYNAAGNQIGHAKVNREGG